MAAPKPHSAPSGASMRNQLLRESLEMIRFAFARGKSVPTSVITVVERFQEHPAGAPPLDCGPLSQAHARLAKLVDPATPAGIVLMADESSRDRRLEFLGTVPLVRRLMKVALGCMLLFILLSLTKVVNGTDVDILHGEGWELLVNELFWLSAAGIGASFAILFQVNDYIVRCNYDPKYEPSYWIKFLLGVMAGFILVTLIPIPEGSGAGSAAALAASDEAHEKLQLLRPTLALLGGYSASAVYRILSRLVDAVESLFRGNPKELIAEREQAAAARASEEATGARMRVAARLVALQQEVSAGASSDDVTSRLREIVASLTPEGAEPDTIALPAPQAPITVDAPPEVIVKSARRGTSAAAPAPSAPAPSAPAPFAPAPSSDAVATDAVATAAVAADAQAAPAGEADPEDDSVG